MMYIAVDVIIIVQFVFLLVRTMFFYRENSLEYFRRCSHNLIKVNNISIFLNGYLQSFKFICHSQSLIICLFVAETGTLKI